MQAYPELRNTINILLNVCDGAHTQDGLGFNKFDSNFVRQIIEYSCWTYSQALSIHRLLKKYSSQLLNYGIEYSSLPIPIDESEKKEENKSSEKTDIKEYISGIEWGSEKEVFTKEGSKFIKKAKYFPNNFWNIWKEYKSELKSNGISVSKYNEEWQLTLWLNDKVSKEKENKDLIKPENIELKYSDLLIPYQIDHVKKLISAISNFGGAMDGSDTGTGKTFTSLAVAKELGLFPIVITKKSVVPSFYKVMKEHFKLEGFISNYEQYKFGKTPYYDKEKGWKVSNNTLLIFDECHNCKNYKTKNAEMLFDAADKKIKTIVMSATIADNPLQMYSTGYAIRLFQSRSSYYSWAKSLGCSFSRDSGASFNGGNEDLKRVHNQIYNHKGSRLAIRELGDAFPKNRVITDCYSMDNSEKIQEIYDEMKKELKKLRTKEMNDSSNHLVEILRARQKIELLKIPTIVDMTNDLLEEGNSVAIFVNFNETVKSLSEKLNTNCLIWGSQNEKQREENREAFQDDKERVIICNIRAGGVGISLHDLNGRYSRVSLINPSWSAQDLKQALGRIHRAGAKSPAIQKLVYCSGTIEEKISEKVKEKIKRIDTINDGDLLN